jgi:hypothetical protein
VPEGLPTLPPPQNQLDRLSSVAKAMKLLHDPVGTQIAEEALGSMLPLAVHAAHNQWVVAVRVLKRAEDDLALFEADYKARVEAMNGGLKKRRRAALIEQEQKLSAAEREYMEGRGHLGSLAGEAAQVETRRRLKLELLKSRIAARDRDLPQGIALLQSSRDVLARYVWTQSHSTPRNDDGSGGQVWGNIAVDFPAVVASYKRTIRVLRERREAMFLAQALHELGCAYLAQGGVENTDAAVAQWLDAIDAVFGQMDVIEVCSFPFVALRFWCQVTCE